MNNKEFEHLKLINQASTHDRIYLAGFLDGEGCITTNKYNLSGSDNARLTISNNNKPVLLWIQRVFGGKIYTIKRRTTAGNQTYIWMLYTNQAINLTEMLIPYLKVKHAQAVMLINMRGADKQAKRNIAKVLKELKKTA